MDLITTSLITSISLLVLFIIALVILAARLNQISIDNSRLIQQSKTIEIQKRDLQELNNIKDKFFTIIAHDLKSPMIALRDFSKLLSRHVEYLSKEELIETSKELYKIFDRTSRLSENLLMWAQLQMKEFETKPRLFQPEISIKEIIGWLSNYTARKQITIHLTCDDSCLVFADPDQFNLILRNIITNAIKYSPKGESIQISIRHSAIDKTMISVMDHGVGMSQNVQKNLLRIDKKMSTPGTELEKGTGIGLMLCYEFIKINNGSIHFESKPNKGTEFFIELPGVTLNETYEKAYSNQQV